MLPRHVLSRVGPPFGRPLTRLLASCPTYCRGLTYPHYELIGISYFQTSPSHHYSIPSSSTNLSSGKPNCSQPNVFSVYKDGKFISKSPPKLENQTSEKPLLTELSNNSNTISPNTNANLSSVKNTPFDAKTVVVPADSNKPIQAKVLEQPVPVESIESKSNSLEKPTLLQKIKHEFAHYRDGTKLLITEVKLSYKLVLKMMAGYQLNRRERRQLKQTITDIARLVPFSVFVIVPFAELLLPFVIKLFPSILPSTYEGQKARDAKAATLQATRHDVSNFLRKTLKESGAFGTSGSHQEDIIAFFKKIRSKGETLSEDDILEICRKFKNDLTLGNLSRPQLVAICRYMNLNWVGPDKFLRYLILHRMKHIKQDDEAIVQEGIESLSSSELQAACATRGLKTYNVKTDELREELLWWLNLRLKFGVPSTLLVLSNAFFYAQDPVTGKSVSDEMAALTEPSNGETSVLKKN